MMRMRHFSKTLTMFITRALKTYSHVTSGWMSQTNVFLVTKSCFCSGQNRAIANLAMMCSPRIFEGRLCLNHLDIQTGYAFDKTYTDKDMLKDFWSQFGVA